MLLIARDGVVRDDPTSFVKLRFCLAVRELGEGVCDVSSAICMSKSGVLTGVVQGFLGSSTSS